MHRRLLQKMHPCKGALIYIYADNAIILQLYGHGMHKSSMVCSACKVHIM